VTQPLPLPDYATTPPHVERQDSPTDDLVFYGSFGLLLFAPLAFGAAETWAISACEIAAAALFLAWVLPRVKSGVLAWESTPLFAPMLGFLMLILLQLAAGRSAYAHATFSALQLCVAYGCICFLITQTLTQTTQVRRICAVLTSYGTLVAAFAVLQSLTSNGKLYWLRAAGPGRWVYGPYLNHNRYAGLMEMLAPIPLVFAFTRYAHGRRRWLAAAASAFMGATIFLSGSRGGMAAFAVQTVLFFWFLFRERTSNRTTLILSAFLLMALASVAWIGGSEVSDRIATVTSHHSEMTSDLRLAIYRDSVRMFAHRPLLGWGLGTFADVFPEFQTFYTDQLANHAHNDYLEVLAETGIVGFTVAVWFLIVVFRRAARKLRDWSSDVNGATSLTALVGISGVLVHSLVDSNLQMPANAMLFFTFCSIAAMDTHFRNHRRKHRTQPPIDEAKSAAPAI
jgi:O-antigen ligase